MFWKIDHRLWSALDMQKASVRHLQNLNWCPKAATASVTMRHFLSLQFNASCRLRSSCQRSKVFTNRSVQLRLSLPRVFKLLKSTLDYFIAQTPALGTFLFNHHQLFANFPHLFGFPFPFLPKTLCTKPPEAVGMPSKPFLP